MALWRVTLPLLRISFVIVVPRMLHNDLQLNTAPNRRTNFFWDSVASQDGNR